MWRVRRTEVRPALPFMLLVTLSFTAFARSTPTVIAIVNQSSIVLAVNGHNAKLSVGEHLDNWTLMQVVKTSTHPLLRYAVLEDFAQPNGQVVFADADGVKLALSKASEPTSGDPAKFYLGHSIAEVTSSRTDLLGQEILAKSSDPEYGQIASAFPPIRKMNPYNFLGNSDKF